MISFIVNNNRLPLSFLNIYGILLASEQAEHGRGHRFHEYLKAKVKEISLILVHVQG